MYEFAYKMQTNYEKGILKTKELRKLADMGDTHSEIVLSSSLLKKWQNEGKVIKLKKGSYKFVPKELPEIDTQQLLNMLKEKNDQ